MLLLLQNMLFEIEQKVSYLSELSVHSESLLLEGRAETKGEAEQLTLKLHSLKDSLLELQQMLQDKQVDIQVRSEIVCVSFCFLTISSCPSLSCAFPFPPFPHVFFPFPSVSFPSLCLCHFCCAVLHYVALVTASMVALCKH